MENAENNGVGNFAPRSLPVSLRNSAVKGFSGLFNLRPQRSLRKTREDAEKTRVEVFSLRSLRVSLRTLRLGLLAFWTREK